jgi:c-di-GMP-binding flagellar brake protein YcgR
MESSQDRRQHDRKPLTASVVYRGSPGVSSEALTDISLGGARLLLSGCEQPGTDIELAIEFSSGKAVSAPGRIVWARQSAPFEVGVRFLTLTEEASRVLECFLQ